MGCPPSVAVYALLFIGSPRTAGTYADSPRLRLRFALRPRDVLRLALPVPLELAADVLHRYATHDRPAVRAEVRRPRPPEIRDEPLHLLARQRCVGLDRAATRHERQRALHRRRVGLRTSELVDGGFQQP